MNLETTRKIECSISQENLKSAIEMFLNSLGIVKLNEDVEIKLGNIKGPLGEALSSKIIPLHLEIKQIKEVST